MRITGVDCIKAKPLRNQIFMQSMVDYGFSKTFQKPTSTVDCAGAGVREYK